MTDYSPPTSVPSTPPSTAATLSQSNPILPSLGIATLSLGSCDAGHSLVDKLQAASETGFNSVELFDNDWYDYRDKFAKKRGYPLPAEEGDLCSREAAKELGSIAKRLNLEFSCFQPLRAFEGFVQPEDRRRARKHAQGILDILALLGTELVLVCSTTNPSPQTTGDLDSTVEDLSWLADLAATYSPPIRIMYEALSFGTHRQRWQDVWEVIEKANRPNLGLCLDSFNTLAFEWADPYQPSGRKSNDVDEKLEENLAELVRRVPGDKIFFYQVADGRFMKTPLTLPTDPSIPRLRPWSRSHRLFPLETSQGAYLPVDRFSDAIIRTGYKGPWSIEVFNDSLSEKGKEVPLEHARRGYEGLRKAAIETFNRAGKA
ncbi:sugar phosphate isomerase/epimerase family protein [Sporobolomyces salmoneus]|uniref:sugar phosphate isomerase/epimerase family protein n=1 Tax=Sporobolomyces salmoneus TaxID=183962 RepID=UPI003176C514